MDRIIQIINLLNEEIEVTSEFTQQHHVLLKVKWYLEHAYNVCSKVTDQS